MWEKFFQTIDDLLNRFENRFSRDVEVPSNSCLKEFEKHSEAHFIVLFNLSTSLTVERKLVGVSFFLVFQIDNNSTSFRPSFKKNIEAAVIT